MGLKVKVTKKIFQSNVKNGSLAEAYW